MNHYQRAPPIAELTRTHQNFLLAPHCQLRRSVGAQKVIINTFCFAEVLWLALLWRMGSDTPHFNTFPSVGHTLPSATVPKSCSTPLTHTKSLVLRIHAPVLLPMCRPFLTLSNARGRPSPPSYSELHPAEPRMAWGGGHKVPRALLPESLDSFPDTVTGPSSLRPCGN